MKHNDDVIKFWWTRKVCRSVEANLTVDINEFKNEIHMSKTLNIDTKLMEKTLTNLITARDAIRRAMK